MLAITSFILLFCWSSQ